MARTKRAAQLERSPVSEAPVDAELPLATALPNSAEGGESPAIGLRRMVEDAFTAPEERWSSRKTVLFIVVVCGAFWAAVGVALFKLI
jgi:hypothetical protein